MKGVQWFIRGVDEEIDPFCVSDQNFGFNLSKHITLNFIRYECQTRTMHYASINSIVDLEYLKI